MALFTRTRCYAQRAIRPAELVLHRDWRLKRYDITIDGSPVPAAAYEEGLRAALAMLPEPAVAADRPGVGFVILHPGRELYYIVLTWWDNQNEMIQRVLVRDAAGGAWRDGAGRYSFCVWDAEVIWHERGAYVRHVMTPADGPDVEAYIADAYRPGAAPGPRP